ncbi:hypothetical protein [Micromonospora sp. ATCC 39149]|uniref:Uncharacterized protein n=1 Tax=Micromonospora carbonacea TaxID=47853 RepID=A0A7D5YGT9_9ACTN|nr:hypothetical protein [Micromonospora sp. ATCC 39149]QLJ97374.1 hypothetical protein HZU44_21435 [Micromonospora carbonacea]
MREGSNQSRWTRRTAAVGGAALKRARARPAPSGLATVSGSSAPSLGTSNWFEKSCPAGKHAIGAGGAVVGASNSEVILEDLRIQQNSVVVAGAEDNGFAGTWWLDATAICADPLPGEQRVVDDSAYSSAVVQSVVATCPPGTRVHGWAARSSAATAR